MLSDKSFSESSSSENSPTVVKDISVYFNHKNLQIVKRLNKANFSVYLAFGMKQKQYYAMKIFPFINDKPHSNYLNELRFAELDHPNIVRYWHCEHERYASTGKSKAKISYTVMEFAPYSDFYELLMTQHAKLCEAGVRTYFRQLIEALEYLHNLGVAHLDLKLENLLLGENFELKVADFDQAYVAGDTSLRAKGTQYFRAPELKERRLKDPRLADIYSAGIVLFVMNSKGTLPHLEDDSYKGINFNSLMCKNEVEFWQKHIEVQKLDPEIYTPEFKELFINMVREDANERWSIKQIKASKWYNGPVLSASELEAQLKVHFQ